MNLDLAERQSYVRMLGERIEQENQALEAVTERLRTGSKR
jgi:hypothetical protein